MPPCVRVASIAKARVWSTSSAVIQAVGLDVESQNDSIGGI
jgi:hypothetical protein